MNIPTHVDRTAMTITKEKLHDVWNKYPIGVPFYVLAAISLAMMLYILTESWTTIVIYAVCFVLGYFTGWCTRRYVS